MRKAIVAIAMSLFAGLGALGAFLPNVGDGTSPNVWTRNMDGVLAAAQQTGHPILLVMVNEDSDGAGCSHCREFVARTINTANFTALVNDYTFYMVFLNCYGFEMRGSLHPQNGDVSSAYFDKYWYQYTVSAFYPLVAVIRPDGTRYGAWSHGTIPATNYYNFYEYLRAAIAALAPQNTIFSLESASSNVQSVSPTAAASWTGSVVRSGGSGKTGTVTISLSGANAANYALDLPSISWGTGDGTVSFTVTGPYSTDGGIIDDTLTVSISASGFDGSTIDYGNTSQILRFKDSRIAQTLDEYSAVSGIDGLSPVSGVWYVPASSTDGNVLQTLTKDSSSMVWRPSTGGFVTLSSNVYVEPVAQQPDPVQPDPAQSSGTQPDPTQPGSTQPDPTQSSGTQPDPTQSSGTQPDPTQSSGTQPDPTQSSGTQPDPTLPGGPVVINGRSSTRSTAAAAVVNRGSLIVSINGVRYDLSQLQSVRLGFSAGDEIVFTATAPVQGEYAEIGLTRFDVDKLVVSISAPANGTAISLPQLINDHALANLAWSANKACSRYEVLDAAGNVLWPTTETGVNGVDIGFVSLAEGTATYNWSVRGYYDCANEALDNGVNEISTVASSSFLVASSPEFGVMPSVVTAYLKLNASIDFAARAGTTEGVSYSASGLPRGMKIDPATGMISGIPKKAGTYNVSVTASNGYGSSTVAFTLKVERQLKAAKASAQLMLFDGSGNIIGSVFLKTTANGKWTLKTITANNTATTKGSFTVSGTGTMQVSGNGVALSGDVGSGLWNGTVAGSAAYGAKIVKLPKSWQGPWNSGVGTSADGTRAGYVVAKVAFGGKVTSSGKIGNRANIRGSGYGALLPAAFVSAYLPAWAGHGDVLFVHLNKKKSLNGGYALFGDGTLRGNFILGAVAYDKMEGGKWNKPSLAGFNGTTLSTVGCGDASFAIAASGSSVSAARNAIGAKVRVNKNTGLVRMSYRNGRTICNGSGAAYVSGGVLQAFGGGLGGNAWFSFAIR